MGGALERFLERAGAAKATANAERGFAVEQALSVEFGQDFVGESQRFADRLGALVPERDFVAGAGEADGPGAADEPESDESDLAQFLPPVGFRSLRASPHFVAGLRRPIQRNRALTAIGASRFGASRGPAL